MTRWRHIASGLLRDARATVAEVSMRLGYKSEASFSRAFKRVVGVPPSTLRRRGVEGEAAPIGGLVGTPGVRKTIISPPALVEYD